MISLKKKFGAIVTELIFFFVNDKKERTFFLEISMKLFNA
jgi:hypothetical protein